MKEPKDRGPVECEPANWATGAFSFIPWNEYHGWVWCLKHYCWHPVTLEKKEPTSEQQP